MELAIAIVVSLIVGAVAALKVLAPKTASTTDDRVLEKLEALEKVVKALLPPAK